MPQYQFLFSTVFGFRKVVLKIFSELDATKAKVPILLSRTRSSKGSRRAAWSPTDVALPLIYSFPRETLNTRASIHEKFRNRRHR